jgi:KUP system potassium uptake protein
VRWVLCSATSAPARFTRWTKPWPTCLPVERLEGILGALSLVFWALTFEVCFKYLGFITKADNRGEGGIFALFALSHSERAGGKAAAGWFTVLILFGAALLYGDGVITPAISVLGAVEGLKDISPKLAPACSPASLA